MYPPRHRVNLRQLSTGVPTCITSSLSFLRAPSVRSRGFSAVIAVEPAKGDTKGTIWFGIDPGMDAQTSPVVWSTRVACPVAGHAAQVVAAPPLVLCRTDKDIFALKAGDGSVAWRYHAAGKLDKMAVAGQRVAVRDGDKLLAVLALGDGRVVRRFDTQGAPLQAAMVTAAGPVALLVAKSGPGTVAGKTHAIVAQPLAEAASTTDARLEPLVPAWRRAFGAADYAVLPSEQTIFSVPVPATLQARDAATGRVLWVDPTTLLPTVEPLQAGLAVAGIRHDGQRWVGLADPRTQVIRWRVKWELGTLHGVGEDNGHLVFLGDNGWLVVRARDGALEGQGEVADDEAIASVQAADHVLTRLVFQRHGGFSWHQHMLNAGPAPEGLTPQPSVPWLSSGWRLVWLDLRHGGRDAETGLPGDGPLNGWASAVTQDFGTWHVSTSPMQDGEVGKALDDLSTPPTLKSAAKITLTPEVTAGTDGLLFAVSIDRWEALQEKGAVDLAVAQEPLQSFHREGLATVRTQVRDTKGQLRWTDMDTELVANGDRTTRLWLLAYGDSALVVRAETPTRTWALAMVEPDVVAHPKAGDAHPTGKSGKKTKRAK